MGVETWNDGYVNVWEPTTDRKVHLSGWGGHTVRSSNKAVTYLTIWDGAGNDDISVGALNTAIYANSGNDRYFIESGINATIYNGSGYKDVGSNYLAGSINVYETNWWSQRNIHVSAYYSYVQSGFADDTISAYGLSQAIVEDAGGNNTVHLGGAGYLKATLGHGSNDVHLWSGWNTDIIQSSGNLSVTGHSYRGGDTTIKSTDHWGTSFYNLAYDGSSWSTKVDARVSNYATINAYGLSWNAINLWGSDGGSKLDISSPGTNEIWATRGNDQINIWTGGRWTEVNLDSGNDVLRIYSGVSAKVTMYSGDKTINTNYLAGDLNIYEWCWWGNSRRSIDVSAGNTYVQTGYGDDTIKAFGLWSATIEDAGGNNSIDARGAGVKVTTGHGNDTIYVSGVSARVASGNGTDSITLDGLDAHLDDGGTWGDKRVLARAGGAYLYTGSGNDSVEFFGLGTHIETSGGNDSVVARGVGAYIDTGAGDDTVDLKAAGATVNTGDGNDRVWSLGVGGQSIDLGNGDDTVEAYGGVNIIHAGRWGKKKVTVGGGANVVQVGHGDSTVDAYGGLNVVLMGQGNNAVNAYGGGNFVLNGNGRFTAKVYGGLNVVLTGQGPATLDAYGSTNILMAGDGGNTIRAYGFGYMTGIGNLIISGSGNDRIKAGSLLGVATTSFGVSDDEFSFDRVVVMDKDAGETIKKTALNIASLVLNAATNAGNVIIAGDGNNKVKAYGGYNMIQSGSGDDEITMVGGINGALVGNGRNRIFAIGSANIVVAGSGNDEMQAIGGANIFFANAGNNRMTAIGAGNLFVAADGDDDMLAVGGGNIAILGGGNNTALLAGGYGNVVQAGSGDDRVISLGQWNVMVLGDGNNTVGALGGGGNLVWTGSGNDTVIALGLYAGNILLLGDGNNFAIAGGRANVVLTGSGRDSVLAVGQYNLVSTANGIDNVIAIGQYNLVHTGGDADIAAVIGETNFVDTGWGDDVTLVIGKTNIVLTEAGDDVALVLGQNNFVLSGSGNDMVGVFGETNYVLTGSGHDLVAVFGKKNMVATDNEIVFTDDDLGALKESKKVKSFNSKGEDWSKKTGMDVSTQAELKLSMDLSFYFPDIEFSTPNTNDWKYPTLTLPSVSYQIPSTPALRSSPSYEYGTLGSYGIPSLSFPQLSTPQLQLPGITVPSFSLPNFQDMGVNIGQLKPNFFVDFNVGSDWFGGASSGFQSLTGLPGPSGGSSGTLLGGKLSVQPKLTGDVSFNHADLTGKVSGNTEASANAIVANANTHANGQAASSTDGTNSSSGKVFGAGNVFSAQNSGDISSSASPKADAFLMVDGSTNSADAFWKQQVSLVAGADYVFSFWAASGTDPQPQLQFYLDGDKVGSVQTLNQSSGWTQYSIKFTAMGEGNKTMSLKNLTTAAGGTDFGVDNLRLESASNFIKNGDFSNGNQGFATDYTMLAQANGPKTLAVVNAPPDWGLGISTGYGSVTSNSFLMVDGSTNSTDVFWKQSVNLVAGADYVFSFWAASGSDPQPQLQFAVDGTTVGAVQTLSPSSGWTQYSVKFTAPADGNRNLSLKNLTTAAGGNDFGLDSLKLESVSNLIKNGDFSNGSQSFASDYTMLAQANGAKTAAVVDAPPDWGMGFNTGQGSASAHVTQSNSDGAVVYALPVLSFGDIKLPNLQLNGFDFSGYSKLFTTLFSGRDLFGATLPDFSLPEFKVDNFNLSDYVGGTQALTIKGTSYALPSLFLPRIAGLDYQSRLPTLSTNYQFNQGEGDVAVVGGQDNRVMTGPGDDLALVLGQTNILLMGDGNDAGLMVGEKNAWRGGKGNDFILAGGKENTLKGQDDNDVILALGLTNKVEGGSGDDVLLVMGKSNAVDGGEGKDLMLVVGMNNDINGKAEDTTGDGNDTILVLGMENTVKAGRGDDWVIACGMTNTIDGGQGNDVVLAVGWSNKVYGDFSAADNGNDVIAFIGGKNAIQGNGGNDLIMGAGLGNQVQGNAGDDIVITAGLAQSIDLGDGDDKAVTLGATNNVVAGAGNDVLYVVGAANNVFGGTGDDVLFALGAGNLLWGQEGNDIFLAQGIASRQLAAQGKLSCTVEVIDMALDALNNLGNGLSSEAVPKTLNDYARSDNTNTYAYGAAGQDTFYSGFQNVVADGGDGNDKYVYYLGDGSMTVRDNSAGGNTLSIETAQIKNYGANIDITTNDLFYDSSSKALSVIHGAKKYGEVILDGFGGNTDVIALKMTSSMANVALNSLHAYTGAAPTVWSPSLPANMASALTPTGLNDLYGVLNNSLAINATVLG